MVIRFIFEITISITIISTIILRKNIIIHSIITITNTNIFRINTIFQSSLTVPYIYPTFSSFGLFSSEQFDCIEILYILL